MSTVQTVKACLSLFRVRFGEGVQYRVAALSGVLISVFWALIECVVFTVFFTHTNNPLNSGGMTLAQTLSYVWIQQGVWVMLSMSIDGDILTKIRNGDIGIELCRPIDLYVHWYTKTSAGKLGAFWMRSLLTLAAGALMPAAYALGAPASPAGLVLSLAALVLAFILCNAYAMLVTAIRVNITWGDGPVYMLLLVSGLLCGSYLPLRLWPASMQTFLRLQPFAGFADVPAQLYVGTLAPRDSLGALALQVLWSVVFIAAGRLILKRRLTSVIVQGG